MNDLWFAQTIMAWVAAMAACLGVQFGRRAPHLAVHMAALSLCIAAVFQIGLATRLEWAVWVESSAVIVWSKLAVVLLAFTAGVSITNPRMESGHRAFLGLGLSLLGVVVLIAPTARRQWRPVPHPEVGKRTSWSQDVCIQSTEVTCAPAAAATLLVHHGIRTTENRMIQACLTSADGTEGLGLFRGLARATENSNLRPQVLAGPCSTVVNRRPWPAIALVRFPNDRSSLSPLKRSFTEAVRVARVLSFAGVQGDGHAIVIFGQRSDGKFEVGDPAFGRDLWTRQQLEERWAGGVIKLRPR